MEAQAILNTIKADYCVDAFDCESLYKLELKDSSGTYYENVICSDKEMIDIINACIYTFSELSSTNRSFDIPSRIKFKLRLNNYAKSPEFAEFCNQVTETNAIINSMINHFVSEICSLFCTDDSPRVDYLMIIKRLTPAALLVFMRYYCKYYESFDECRYELIKTTMVALQCTSTQSNKFTRYLDYIDKLYQIPIPERQ